MGRIKAVVVMVVCVASTGAAAAASITPVFSQAAGAPGDAVSVRTRGTIPPPGRLYAFLVDPGGDPARFALGRLQRRRTGVARLSFTVPNLPPGDYRAVLERAGRIVGAGHFRIADARPVVRDCESSVYGDLPSGWERRSVHAGPLWLYPFDDLRADDFRQVRGRPGRYWPRKILVLVDTGRTATLRVPPPERRNVALTYGGTLGGGRRGMRVGDGLPAVRFASCARNELPQTQFNGGFVVAGPRCAHLEVAVEGRPEPIALAVPFGREC